MTEEEARKKWCPMVRITNREPPLTNRDTQLTGMIGEEVKCIASDCMLWREVLNEKGNAHGYCGLAGEP